MGDTGSTLLRLTPKAHGHLACSGYCSKHFAEITSFNSVNALMRNNLLYLHFIDEEKGKETGNHRIRFLEIL